MMNDFQKRHLENWLESTIIWDEIDMVRQDILGVVNEHPELLGNRSWPEIRAMAEYIK
uniref:Uncharacterized protein n=1 Tax=viral metagenome TaxID=1070528 RepID=A0A6M3JJE3_9ZZZZ